MVKLTIWDYLMWTNALNFNTTSNKDMWLLRDYNIISFEREGCGVKFIFDAKGVGWKETEYMKLTMETNVHVPYRGFWMFIKYQIEQIIRKHWEANDYETVDVHGASSKTVLSTIPLDEENTIWIEAYINVEGEDDWYINDWEIHCEEKK